jgi:hypothetical protein
MPLVSKKSYSFDSMLLKQRSQQIIWTRENSDNTPMTKSFLKQIQIIGYFMLSSPQRKVENCILYGSILKNWIITLIAIGYR